MSAATTATQAEQSVRRAAESPWVERLARLGFVARGVSYVIVGLLALQIAWATHPSGEASKEGALREIAQRPAGRPLLVVLAFGLAGYAVWRASEAAWGKRDEEDDKKRAAKRAGSAGKAILYTAFFASTVRFVLDGPSAGGASGDRQERSTTATVLGAPGGTILVGAVGLALIVGGLYVAYRGITQKFDERLDTSAMGRVTEAVVHGAGTLGLAARGLLVGVAGYLLLRAALDFDPERATGVDGTLRTIAAQPYGQMLLTLTALGLVAYGLYSFAEARYRRL